MEKKKYEAPRMETYEFEMEGIVVSSGGNGISLSNDSDGASDRMPSRRGWDEYEQ